MVHQFINEFNESVTVDVGEIQSIVEGDRYTTVYMKTECKFRIKRRNEAIALIQVWEQYHRVGG
jgi:hypothetical protein